MQLELFELSVTGDRGINQDAMAHIVTDNFGLFIVADGLGGHHGGEKASNFFCQGMLKFAHTYSKMLAHDPVGVFSTWITDAVNEMKLLFRNDQAANEAHTTCAILYLDNNMALAAHCGDSRVYRMNPSEILWRTHDHSIPQELFDAGMISEQDIAQHPEQNQLTRSINIKSRHRAEIKVHPIIQHDETFVLCSDGFWEHVKQEELLQLADSNCNDECLAKLVRLSAYRANGKSDNITVLSVRCRTSNPAILN